MAGRALPMTLACLDLVPPAMYAQLLVVAAAPTSAVGNWPAVITQGVVATLFLAGSVLLFTQRTRIGILVSLLAVLASLGTIGWIWSGSGMVFTADIALWLIVDCLATVMILVLGRRDPAWSHRHAG